MKTTAHCHRMRGLPIAPRFRRFRVPARQAYAVCNGLNYSDHTNGYGFQPFGQESNRRHRRGFLGKCWPNHPRYQPGFHRNYFSESLGEADLFWNINGIKVHRYGPLKPWTDLVSTLRSCPCLGDPRPTQGLCLWIQSSCSGGDQQVDPQRFWVLRTTSLISIQDHATHIAPQSVTLHQQLAFDLYLPEHVYHIGGR